MPYFHSSTAIGETMSKVCQVTGRKPTRGYKYAIRGIAKKKKGIGLKVTGKTKRRFQPNLFKKRIWFAEENRFITLKLSTAALRTIDRLGVFAVVRKMRANGQSI
ncbi:50S ribosomal protein L28 [Candidatus Protochlamydia amoebophila]|uniref:Large ribosomal subunit protein bL28 n=2 Tax=Parachlamydiaceae TaxID=92713 RepID=A0A0C1JNL4_9BACT|nr:50S ribosomal protein L28 [Candidatus Protochlamydia amoebophila]